MRHVYLALLIVLSVIVFTFKLQNLEVVTVRFLSATVALPMSVLLLAVYFLGMLNVGVLWSVVKSWVQGARARPDPPR
jgi:uncharacterized integral membrane protein